MKIDRAAKKLIEDVELWLEDYKYNHSKDKESWPLQGRSDYEWFEDFLSWKSDKGFNYEK